MAAFVFYTSGCQPVHVGGSLSSKTVGGIGLLNDFRAPNKDRTIHRSRCLWVFMFVVPHAMAMPQTGSAADRQRAFRRAGVELVADRVVRPETRNRRDGLLADFDAWLSQWGLSLEATVDAKIYDAEQISKLLAQYGRELYYLGRPYGVFSETITGITGRRPVPLEGSWLWRGTWLLLGLRMSR